MHKQPVATLLELPITDESVASFSRRFQKTGRKAVHLVVMASCMGLLLLMPSMMGLEPQPEVPRKVKVTAYTNVAACTDSTPNETASLLRIRRKHYGKIIALSRDLAKHYRYGDKFLVRVNGKDHVVEFQDLMAKRHKNSIDLLLPSVKESLRFGVNEGELIPLRQSDRKPSRRTG